MVRGSSRGDDVGKIFVGGLSAETTKEGLQSYFSTFGAVTDCIVMVDNMSGRSRGFGFVTFMDPASVDNVCDKLDHVLDGKKIDPKRAVPRGPGQAAALAQGPVMSNTGGRDPGNENKIFVGGLASNVSDEELRRFFSTFGKAEVKKAEQRESRPSLGLSMSMAGPQMNSGYGRGQYGYPQGGGGQFGSPPSGMGRGFGGYGAMAPAYAGTPPLVGAGYGYGMGSAAMAGGYGVGQTSMYSQGAANPAAGYGSAYPVPTSATSMPATSGYPDYSQLTASQPGMPTAAPGAPPHLDNAPPTDYAAYGLGSYQQQESSYGPARTSFSSEGNYNSYGATDQPAYSGGGTYGESFGRGTSVSRGFHPYGR